MPRYLNLIRIDESGSYEETYPQFEERMGALFEEMDKAGVMLDNSGLAPTSESARVHWAGGRISYTDGPFTETKEVVGGFLMTRCKDTAEAMEWAQRFLQVHPESWTVSIEVREVSEP
ncbi:transcriptional regulator [Streptomonospora sp. PA3]|uniref:YciI family protein n=1 Tax=Streptomonospora sp. PA3 TaxID=2607326 RepID=UPI0012DC883A|nr:YciI family protein [Streptomonospora sp. PA3]MUL43787.1 transcriptional regulator [Streptomonospora sp. PA3]